MPQRQAPVYGFGVIGTRSRHRWGGWFALAALVVLSGCAGEVAPITAGPEATSSTATTVVVEPSIETTTTTTPTTAAPTFVAPPPTERYVEGSIDFLRWLVDDCMAENGGVATLYEGPPPAVATGGRRDHTLFERCWDTARENDWYEPFPDGDEGRRLTYRLYLEVHACLEANGYPTVDPPSEEAFVASGPSLIWNPYAGMGFGTPFVNVHSGGPASAAEREQIEAQRLCGADPATLWAEELAEQEGSRDSP